MPSVASRPPTLSALSPSRTRSSSTAASMSPPVSVSAFLHSIMPGARLVAQLLDLLGGDGGSGHFASLSVGLGLVGGRGGLGGAPRRRALGPGSGASASGSALASAASWRGVAASRRGSAAGASTAGASSRPRRRGASRGGLGSGASAAGASGAARSLGRRAAARLGGGASRRRRPRPPRRTPCRRPAAGAAWTASATCASATSRGCALAGLRQRGLGLGALGGLGGGLLLGLAAGALLGLALLLRGGLGAGLLLLGAEARAALLDHVADRVRDQRAGADRVVVARDHVVDAVGVAVGVDQADDRDPQALGLADGDRLGLEVDDEHRVRDALHVLDAAQVGLQLQEVGLGGQALARRQQRELAVGLVALEVVQALDARRHRLVVRQQAAEPAVVDVRHAGRGGDLLHAVAGLLLGADEQHGAAAVGDLGREALGLLEQGLRLEQVDDVDAAALAVDETAHLRVPTSRLVAEVDSGLQQLLETDFGHRGELLVN